jgi:hypothetical protein
MEGFVPLVEAILDERVEHTMLLISAIKERANVTMLTESAPGKRQRMVVSCHVSPPHKEIVGSHPGMPDG